MLRALSIGIAEPSYTQDSIAFGAGKLPPTLDKALAFAAANTESIEMVNESPPGIL